MNHSVARWIVACGLLALPGLALAQNQGEPFEQGTHALRGIIRSPKPIPGYEKRFELDPILAYGKINPATTTIIVLGDPTPLDTLRRNIGSLRQFVLNGGALLIASDQPIREPLATDFGVEIVGGFVRGHHKNFAGLVDCPLAIDLAANQPIFRRVETLATNRPSALSIQGGSLLQTFAWLPLSPNPRRFRLPPRVPFIAGGELGRGRILIMADHSVFINDMMLQPDTDNFDFAFNCIDWLTDAGRRNQVLLIEDGAIVTNFNVSFKPPPLPNLPSQQQIVERVNDMIVEAEANDQFNQMLLGMFGGWQQPRPRAQARAHERILRLLLLLATAALAIFGLVMLAGARHRVDKHAPQLAGSTAQAVPTQPILHMRQAALAESGNCAEAARHLARRCLEAGGVTQWHTPPRVTAQGNLLQRWRSRRQVRWLWRLATATPRVSPRRLAEITALAGTLRDAFATGSIRLTTMNEER